MCMLKLVLLTINTVKNSLPWSCKGRKLFPFQEVPFNTHTCSLDPRDCQIFLLKTGFLMPKFHLRQVQFYDAIKIKMTNVLNQCHTTKMLVGWEFLALALSGNELCHLQAPVILFLGTDTFIHKKREVVWTPKPDTTKKRKFRSIGRLSNRQSLTH